MLFDIKLSAMPHPGKSALEKYQVNREGFRNDQMPCYPQMLKKNILENITKEYIFSTQAIFSMLIYILLKYNFQKVLNVVNTNGIRG